MAPAVLVASLALVAPAQLDRRDALAAKGLTFGASAQLELVGNATGGRRRNVYLLGIASAFVQWDLSPLLGGAGPRLYAMGLATFGGDPSTGMGDAQFISNIEAPDGVQLFRIWIEQAFADDMLVVRAGVYDLDDVFAVSDTGALFTQSSHGLGPEMSGAGVAGLSTFPTAGPTAHVIFASEVAYGGAAVSAGRPSHPLSTLNVPRGEHDGLLLLAELGAKTERYKAALGAWALSADRPNLQTGKLNGGDRGVYAVLEHRFHDAEEPGLAVFMRLGIARDAVNPVGGYLGGGLVQTGLIPGRPGDRTGIAIAAANGGNGPGDQVWEVDFEVIYAAPIWRTIEVQAFAHWILHPGFDTDAENVLAFGGRLNVSY